MFANIAVQFFLKGGPVMWPILISALAQRDEFVKKYNDSVQERNDIVGKYNGLIDQVKKLQTGGKQ
jgi:hypothetical protein